MPIAGPGPERLDVTGLGNAIVDVIAHAEDELIAELGLEKGIMTLVDEDRMEALYRRLGPARERDHLGHGWGSQEEDARTGAHATS